MKIIWLPCYLLLASCAAAPDATRESDQPVAANVTAAPRDTALTPLQVDTERQGMAGANAPNALCRSGEVVIFQCSMGRQTTAVCGGRAPSGRTYAQYRYGAPGHLELVYPNSTDEGSGGLRRAYIGYSGGGENQVRFSNGGIDYVVYSRMVRTGFGPDGHSGHAWESGVAVIRANRLASDRRCVTPEDAWVDEEQVLRFMQETEALRWGEIEMDRP